MARIRLDNLLVARGISETRSRARAMILAGEVYVDGIKIDKAGALVDEGCKIEVSRRPKYVSRGGIKLEHALQKFGIKPLGYVAVDIGASTGGFTDCLLKNGASKVYAIDVGYGQLDWSLRNDPRVVLIERTNVRYLKPELIDERPDIVVVDVSFISLLKVFPKIREILTCGGILIALIKPQFEVGREKVGKGGIVKDETSRLEAVGRIKDGAASYGWKLRGLIESPIKGTDGNVEYLACWDVPSDAT